MQGQAQLEREWRPNAFWIAAAIYFALVSLGSNLLEIRYSYFDPGLAGKWGFSFTRQGLDATIQSVEPGSKAAALGLKPGDTLHSNEPYFFRRIPVTGETFRFTRIVPGPPTQLQFDAPPADVPPMAVPNFLDRVIDDILRVSLALGGLFILWRGSGRRSGFLLGLALLSMAPFPPHWMPVSPTAFYAWNIGSFSLYYLCTGLVWPLFALTFLEESAVRIPRWTRAVFWAGLFATLVIGVVLLILAPGMVPSAVLDLASRLQIWATIATFLLTMLLFAIGIREGKGTSRHRFALLLVAVGLIFLSNMLFVIFNNLARENPRQLTDSSSAFRMVGAVLFAYAVLRHKVIDVGFTLNRTLVYGGVSAILLAAFGLAEWGMHQVLALEGWEGSAVLSAALAVGIVLAFNPVHHFVEHYVSAIFFRPWRNKEQALRKFVREGGFFTDAGRLAAGFAGALERFTGGSCCVYRLSGDQSYVCATGTMPAVHFDDPVAVALRAQAAVCGVEPGQTCVEGVLAFPMIHAHDLEGFAVLGPKGSGDPYRPDEVELVEWATRQIGQDLYRLDVDQLKREREQRDREIAILTGRNADLQLALANRSSPAKLRRTLAKGAAA